MRYYIALLLIVFSFFIIGAAEPSKSGGRHYTLMITSEITEGTYMAARSVFAKARKGDQVTIYINSPGGDYDAGLAIAHLEDMTEATVTARVGRLAASAATDVMLHADVIIVRPDTQILFHMPFIQGKNGKKIRPKDLRDFDINYMTRSYCAPMMLGKGLWAEYLAGYDVWVTGEEFAAMPPPGKC